LTVLAADREDQLRVLGMEAKRVADSTLVSPIDPRTSPVAAQGTGAEDVHARETIGPRTGLQDT